MKTNKKRSIAVLFVIVLWLQSIPLVAQVTAKKADAFVGSIGINIKLDRDRYKRDNGFNTKVKPALQDLGIRHVRSSHFAHSTYGPQNRQLWENYGTRALFVTGSYEGGQTPQDVRRHSKAAADYIYAVEGQNEPDIFLVEGFGWPYQQYTDRNGNNHLNTSTDYRASRAWHQDMIHYLKSDPATKDLPVATTPMAFGNNVSKIVPIAHDLESFHHYTHRSTITTNLNNTINQTHGYAQGGTPKPLLLSEFGWKTSGSNSVTERTQAKNILTGFCEYFNRGIKVSYIHELIENSWGLLRTGGVRKPAFNGLKNLISLLGEAKFDKVNKKWNYPDFTTKSLDFEVLNAKGSTHKLLLQKSNGSYFLLLWQNVDRSNDDGTDKTIGNDAVTVKVNGNLASATQFRYDADFNFVENELAINNGAINVNVPDNVVVIRLTVPISQGYRKIENKSNKKVIKIDVNGSNGSAVLQYDWKGWDSQKWAFIHLGGSYYKIQNKQNNRVLQANDSNVDGAPITQRTWNNWNPQKWKLIFVGDGYYRIENKANGKCIQANLSGGNNATIAQRSWNNWNSQKWKLTSLSSDNARKSAEQALNTTVEPLENEALDKWQIYPNPASASLWINYSSDMEGVIKIRVSDLSGKDQSQISDKLVQGMNEFEVNTNTLTIGSYLVTVETSQGVHTKKFIISK
ncbi:RICIN domain-containing protein [Fulvivirga sp. M361]|uniref:RICIN domain-containing protein n=1 Tax=Fulvivirga sp. M361 TaxID=2594266 RepID=UPI001628FD5A|nr:RICIN domain-containing protein [Fulvivirga sp. M361]